MSDEMPVGYTFVEGDLSFLPAGLPKSLVHAVLTFLLVVLPEAGV